MNVTTIQHAALDRVRGGLDLENVSLDECYDQAVALTGYPNLTGSMMYGVFSGQVVDGAGKPVATMSWGRNRNCNITPTK